MVFTEQLLAQSVCTRSIEVLGWQPGAPKTREHGFPTKRRDFFETHRTSDSSMGSVAHRTHAYGLYRTLTSQNSVCKVK